MTELEKLRQIVIDYTYATSYMAPNCETLAAVRRAAAEAVPELVGHPSNPHKAKPSWERGTIQ